MTDPPAPTRPRALRRLAWVNTSYFAEGFPYTMVNSVADFVFIEAKASLQIIGLTSLFHLPWNLKFLWAPWVDLYETKRRWLVAFELVLTVLFVLLAFTSTNMHVLVLAAVLFTTIAAASATHDTAVDGFYLEALDADAQAEFVGYRVAAYRAAMASASPIVGITAWITGPRGWVVAWIAAAVVMAALAVFHALVLPHPEPRRQPIARLFASFVQTRVLVAAAIAGMLALAEHRYATVRPILAQAHARVVTAIPVLGRLDPGEIAVLALLGALLGALAALPRIHRRLARGSSSFSAGYVAFLEQPHVGRILAFVILFRLGESLLLKMRLPFFTGPLGLPKTFIAVVVLGVALFASILATIVAGHLIARQGLRKWIWPFVIAQNLSNLAYVVPALVPTLSPAGTTVVVMVENVTSGLGTAVLMVYIMRCCDPRHRATHMSILTALMSIGFTVAGVMSGSLASAVGWPLYFVLTFVATIPSMALLPFVPHIDERPRPPDREHAG